MIRGIRIFFKALGLAVAQKMAYRGDYFISLFFFLLLEMIFPFITLIIYRAGSAFPGWGFYEVLLLQGTFSLASGITYSLFSGLQFTVFMGVREGTFDLILIKPMPAIFTSVINGFELENGGCLLSGLMLFIVALVNLPAFSLLHWVQFILLFLLGIMVLLSVILFMSGTLFIWVGNGRLWEIFDVICNFGRYPASIFAVVIKTIISVAIPVTMIAFFPASALLGRVSVTVIAPVVVAIFFFLSGIFFWHKMLEKYTSAGG